MGIVAVSVFLASIALFMCILYEYFSQVQKNQLKMQTDLASRGVEIGGAEYLDGLDVKNYRITWVAPDGLVLYDSQSNISEMENHLERQEIKQAFAQGSGESSRYSVTLLERSLYYAERLSDGTVLRLSVAQNTLLTITMGMMQPICIIFVIAMILSLVLASRLSKKIVKPLNELNLDEPLKNDDYEELSPLLRRIDMQQKQIKAQRDELRQKQLEFETVTTNMKEGIVLLNSTGKILSINRAALRLLEAGPFCVGKDILSINRSVELTRLLRQSAGGQYAEKVVEFDGSVYQFDANPVISEGKVSGTVLLMLDVSGKMESEQMRREFTANVSHELKTPLHTISGCSELLAGGLVKPEDTAKFSGRIYAEAQRMIRLVEDIIRLSHLDEGADDMQREEIDLYALAEDTLKTLQAEAEAAKVTLSLSGGPAGIYGIPQLLRGIIFNLCDNGIKYNREGGWVHVAIKEEEGAVVLSVRDTGIGIPKECQERIFERFYRVDKSRSKEVGGTGLGLSIVKHSVRLHNGAVEVESVVNEGTVMTVRFPKQHMS